MFRFNKACNTGVKHRNPTAGSSLGDNSRMIYPGADYSQSEIPVKQPFGRPLCQVPPEVHIPTLAQHHITLTAPMVAPVIWSGSGLQCSGWSDRSSPRERTD
ncbi:hypothetical protein L873DRAFT_1787398 [Choiromyces venosus 120613-1]|uniref:Uncharacterized protein n=1 Tax=Choiromyces venosus 120613-1 TaxID=1336337 RepID=A0A3N4JX70_9PEZI|nr:hypothetical protein L873DRAFT_1787398 [Choiromyces venosus 120613-1]